MKEFPESSLLVRKQLLFANVVTNDKPVELPPDSDKEVVKKIWQFKSSKNYTLNVTNDSLDITSQFHKTYNNKGSENKFRDIIEFVVSNFTNVISVPMFTRIGLRYTDECPIVKKNNTTLRAWYNSTFPLSRFNIADASEMDFKTVVKIKSYTIRYFESLQRQKDDYKLVLDYDGSATNINTGDYLKITDVLHDIISNEYKKNIKKPLYDYMRKNKVVES